MQHPIMVVLQGGMSASVIEWEAELETVVADLITRHLEESPCPGPSEVARDLDRWADLLRDDAQSRLGLVERHRQLA